ncbi:MAG: tyrosine--tRNA ligase [Planctomycetaceae bacterium]|nr:MAG: tyrosine--tRNA ligase [Planctomycetaceae bacterium]
MIDSLASILSQLRRGVEKIVPEEELAPRLAAALRQGSPLRIKYGIDPTGIDVHLGHTVPLRKLRQFQDLGHQAILIIGSATAMVGDPSGRDQARSRQLSAEEVAANARTYLEQVRKVLDLSRVEIYHNGDWFLQMQFGELLRLCGQVTVAQLLTRDDFAQRYAAQQPIFLHECIYPVMQAFDSVVVGADVELGGTEQLYSFMLARDLQKNATVCQLARRWMPSQVQARLTAEGTLPPQIGIMSPILVGLDGTRRMGKSLGNYIGINESAYDMMKKLMQLPDAAMPSYFDLLTDLTQEHIRELLAGHPKRAKMELAKLIIRDYHDLQAAESAAERWQREIGEGQLPEEIPTVTIERSVASQGALAAATLFKVTGLVSSTSEARRLISGGGAYYGDQLQPITHHDQMIPLHDGMLLKAGKKKIVRLRLPE